MSTLSIPLILPPKLQTHHTILAYTTHTTEIFTCLVQLHIRVLIHYTRLVNHSPHHLEIHYKKRGCFVCFFSREWHHRTYTKTIIPDHYYTGEFPKGGGREAMSLKVRTVFLHDIFVFSVRWVSLSLEIQRNFTMKHLYLLLSTQHDRPTKAKKITRDHVSIKQFGILFHFCTLSQIMPIFPTHPATVDDCWSSCRNENL